MNVFNSLGSNYNFDFVIKALTLPGTEKDTDKLVSYLEKKYGGKAALFYKGREALEAVFKTAKLDAKSLVAINGFTCYAVVKAIENSGLKVEYIDIKDDLNFSSESLEEKIKEKPQIKAVIVQNTLGYPCDIEKIIELCRKYKLILIEDLAHSIGSVYKNGKEAGTIGDFVMLSFSQDKMIDGVSGGALIIRNTKYLKGKIDSVSISQNQETIDRVYPLFTFLIRSLYKIKLGKLLHFILKNLGFLSKPMTYQDSGSLHKLSGWYALLINDEFARVSENLAHRREIAKVYAKNLDKKVLGDSIVKNIDSSSNLRFPIFIERREGLVRFLKGFGIYVSDIWYDAPVAPRKYMDKVNYDNSCPASEKISGKILNLPTHRNINQRQAKEIAERINKWLQK